MKAFRFACCLSLVGLFLGSVAIGAVGQANVLALSPEAQTAEWAKSWWMPRHEQKLAEAADQVDALHGEWAEFLDLMASPGVDVESNN